MKKKNKRTVKCIAYLSVEGELRDIEFRENRQLRYIREYAAANQILICKIIRRNGMGQKTVNMHWDVMTELVRKGIAEGIVIANTQAVSSSVPDAFYKVGQVQEAGGIVVTVDEGRLQMPVKRMIEGKMVLVNERV